MNIRVREAADAIKEQTNGRVDIQIFPSNQLGSDTDMLSQLRAGGIDFFTLSGLILSTLVPRHRDQRRRLRVLGLRHRVEGDGRRARRAHPRGQIGKANLVAMDKIWDNGFRQITSSTKPINTADDLKGFKIRVPVSPMWTSMFKAFDAAPASINFVEVYSALQTKVVDGQENPLAIIETAKLYEVQKYVLGDQPHVGRLLDPGQPPALGRSCRTTCAPSSRKHVNAAALKQRADVAALNGTLQKAADRQGHDLQPAQDRRLPRPSCARPASMPSGRRSSATRPGRCSRSTVGKLS